MDETVESIPFPPLLPPHATVMLMGTFPPKPEKRAMAFHYPNFNNDMWRVFGLVFFGDAAHFRVPSEKAFNAEKIKAFLWERGIASCPTVWKAVRLRGNASDQFLKIVEAVDLPQVLSALPHCRAIGTTGGKASEVLWHMMPFKQQEKMPKSGAAAAYCCGGRTLRLWRLPSTSRAYPLPLAQKAAAYRAFFEEAGLV